jgi:uncharacterized membrane protein (DUF2068 family)
MFEATKGVLVVAAGFSLFAFVHGDVSAFLEQLVAQLHFNPAKHFPKIFAMLSSGLSDAHLRLLALLAALYSSMRFIEAYGLWFGKSWAEWFALVSCSVYIPIEIYELWKGFSWLKIGFISVNLAIVLYLAFVLRRSRTAHLLVKEGGAE